MDTMTDTPETDQAECESIAAYIEAYGPDAVFPCDGYDHARKLERERDELAERLDFQEKLNRECIDQITDRTNERDEARGGSWFLNGAEYRKRSGDIEARNNLNPHWVVVDSQTNQKP